MSKGGYDLLSFDNMGMVPYSHDPETNTVIYRARAIFGFEVNAWTSALFRNIYPRINIENVISATYLTTQNWEHIGFHFLPIGAYQTSTASYGIKYRSIDYGTTSRVKYNAYGVQVMIDNVDVPGSYLPHDYHGSIPATITISPGLRFSGSITVAGQTFTVPKITSDIIYTQISGVRSGEAGGYSDRYSDQGMDTASVTLTLAERTLFNSGAQKITDWFNDGQVGKISNQRNETITIQQSIIDESHSNDRFDSINTDNTQVFSIPIHLQPEVTKVRNYFDLVTGSFMWFNDGHFNMNPAIVTKTMQRDVSIHVQNVFIHYDFKVITDIFMTAKFSAELSETFLNDPNLKISDMVWDTSIWGDKKVEIMLTSTFDIWSIIMGIIILIIVLAVVYIIYRRYKKKKRGGGGMPMINILTGGRGKSLK